VRGRWTLLAGVLSVAPGAAAATFDAGGYSHWEPDAVFSESFENPSAPGVTCEQTCTLESRTNGDELALEGKRWVHVTTQDDALQVEIELPRENAAYRFRIWVRHARMWARVVLQHDDDPARGTEVAWLYPSGRVTSDGWVELESNSISVTGRDLTRAYLRMDGTDFDLDALEVTPEGEYHAGGSCLGARDPICGSEAICVEGRCRQGNRFVPPLPPDAYRKSVALYLEARVHDFFGGKLTREEYMPAALAEIHQMLEAQTPWQYWAHFGRGVRLLHDWHTSASSPIAGQGGGRRLGLCFVEGDADLTQATWPSQAGHMDVLVSHVGPSGTLGLVPGDRLVAVDGQHPLVWAASLKDVNWGYHVASDPDVDADFAEALRDLIPRYAQTFSVIRCDPKALTCSGVVEHLDVDAIETGVQPPACDNRPSYHLKNPPENTPGSIETYHYLPFVPWRDKVVDSQPGEDIYGMTFDSLYGTSNGLTPFFQSSNQYFKDNARGVILDHRAGNGGTIDAPQAITELVRTKDVLSVGPTFMTTAAYDGPATLAEGADRAQFLAKNGATTYQVGSSSPDLAMPVALLIHRDGSASDWLPYGMKGAPNVRVFGPHQTAGAFSSFYQFGYWSHLDFQLASGDTLAFDGTSLLGHGIEPDEIVVHTQTSLLSGKDAVYEAGLSWVRSHLKP